MNSLRVAAIQMSSTADRDENLEAASLLMGQAVQQGAELIVLPEHFSYLSAPGGYIASGEDPETGPSIRFLSNSAATNRVAIVGGSIPLPADAEHVFNSSLALGTDGSVLGRYDKVHLFDVDLDDKHQLRESDEVAPGSELVVVTLAGVGVGLSICYDLRFPELYRGLVSLGARVLTIPSNFTVPTGREHWEVLLRARAIENQCYVVAPAQCGHRENGFASYGHSMIVDPWGTVLAHAGDQPGVVIATLDFDHLEDVRRRLPSLKHRRVTP